MFVAASQFDSLRSLRMTQAQKRKTETSGISGSNSIYACGVSMPSHPLSRELSQRESQGVTSSVSRSLDTFIPHKTGLAGAPIE